jgi:hypothetical protein
VDKISVGGMPAAATENVYLFAASMLYSAMQDSQHGYHLIPSYSGSWQLYLGS